MLSYRHAFHAGNFADVLKHLVLIQILNHLKIKEKPFCYIDTHAGPGSYDLRSDYALKNREFDSGIGKLWLCEDLPEAASEYLNLVKQFNQTGALKCYPGSPLIARQLMRRCDRLLLFELHSTEIQQLKTLLAGEGRIKVNRADGLFESLGILPPIEHRGLVLIDPSYEVKSDYDRIVETLIKMKKRFANGLYALWYPVIDRSRNRKLERAIQTSGIKNVRLFELGIKPDSKGLGMTASGMIVINSPWTLASEMQQVLPWLADKLGENGGGHYRNNCLVSE
ncbi:MAG: 23S rRNA (adenine(2030)-N(6))-methyltransferase RlmJ [Gammaproteobacteria bacterium]